MKTPFSRLAAMVIDNRKRVGLLWLAVLVVAGALAAQVQGLVKVGGYSLPGTEFHESSEILRERLDQTAAKTALAVYRSDTLKVYDKQFEQEVSASFERLLGHSLVKRIESFYETGIPDFVSKDNRTLYAIVFLDGSEEAIERATPEFRTLAASEIIEVSITGIQAANYDIEQATGQDMAAVEVYSFPLVLLLLFLFFRSVLLGVIPIVVGVVSILITLGILAVLAYNTDVSIFAINCATMIGLGLAIDFSLIALDRFRREVQSVPYKQAIETMLNTSGRAILLSGVTLFMTMIVWALFPIMIISSIALAISLSAIVAVVTALLLMPLILSFLGPRLEKKYRSRPVISETEGQFWRRFCYKVMGSPWASVGIACVILFALAYPALNMNRTGVTLDVVPPVVESRYAADILAENYGKGAIGPIMVAVEAGRDGGIWQREIMEGLFALHEKLRADPRVENVRSLISLRPNPSAEWATSLSQRSVKSNQDYYRIAKNVVDIDGANRATVMYVFSKENEVHPSTIALLEDIRANAEIWAPGLRVAQTFVGGAPAMHYDFTTVLDDQVPLYLGLSLLVNFVTLMIVLKTVIIPIKAVLTNLLSLFASFGALVIIFQYGFGASLFGAETIGAIILYTPVIGFAILYGLSTDYEVFLMTRVRERMAEGLGNDDAVAAGVQDSARVITTAGLIMIVVFGSFAFTQVQVTREIGLVLAIAILIDMTIVRLVLVPATMKLMGARNWWFPKPLDRWIPEIREA